jgi:hypothetical protein
MDINKSNFWFDRTDRMMKEQQNKEKLQLFTVSEQPECQMQSEYLMQTKESAKVRRIRFSLANYTILIERKARA